jgi:hypothetical protein
LYAPECRIGARFDLATRMIFCCLCDTGGCKIFAADECHMNKRPK